VKILAVDLAAKYSASCVMDDAGRVYEQNDSWGRTEKQFLDLITSPWMQTNPPDLMVVEDLPHGVSYMTTTKAVCRLQGRIVERMDYLGSLSSVLFAAPIEWRRVYTGLERGTGAAAVVPVAEALGYTAPDLSHRILRAGDKAIARKVASDYCAAYLIAKWMIDRFNELGTFDVTGTARYGATRSRKKQPVEKRTPG